MFSTKTVPLVVLPSKVYFCCKGTIKNAHMQVNEHYFQKQAFSMLSTSSAVSCL